MVKFGKIYSTKEEKKRREKHLIMFNLHEMKDFEKEGKIRVFSITLFRIF